MIAPPAAEAAMGLATYLTEPPGCGGRLRGEPEDFQVIELGPGPRPADGPYTAARIRLRNWETNRFVGKAAQRVGIRRGHVGFAGMKDKRAVTEQWFSFKCPADRLVAIEELQDVDILETRRTASKQFPGAHEGNRFILRIRDHHGERDAMQTIAATIQDELGVPHFFGPQRFGSGVRPITHLMGKALVAGELEEAVRLYCGHPMPGEREETFEARRTYEVTRDPEATLALLPKPLDLERSILQRLKQRPGQWHHALQALPRNLLTLFVHSWQSYLFNHILSARIDAGLGLRTAHIGDRVMAHEEDGLRTHLVTHANQARVQDEIDRGRAAPTAPLLGLEVPMAQGEPGAIEQRTLAEHGAVKRQFRAYWMPSLASAGRRRTVLQSVRDLRVDWQDGDPVVAFALGKGSYATVVMREFMKADITAY